MDWPNKPLRFAAGGKSPSAGERKDKTNDSMLNGAMSDVNERNGLAAHLLGKCQADTRLPIGPLTMKNKARIEEAMRGAGLLAD